MSIIQISPRIVNNKFLLRQKKRHKLKYFVVITCELAILMDILYYFTRTVNMSAVQPSRKFIYLFSLSWSIDMTKKSFLTP